MQLCRHLNYIRSLSPGKAVFYYQAPECDFVPIQVETNRIRAAKSGFTEAYDKNQKLKNLAPQDLAYSNPQCIDACYVPPNVPEFSLRVEANSLQPDCCEDEKVRRYLTKLAATYAQVGGYQELARRYCKNILLGTWLWRNEHTLGTQVDVQTSNGNSYVIVDARRLDWLSVWSEEEQAVLNDLTSEMAMALCEPKQYWFADIKATLKTGFCQELHPSQKFIDNHGQGESSKQYATVGCVDGNQAACFHAEKVGAALHLIDDWWDEDADKRLRTHEYGADRDYLIARRHPVKKQDFYSLLTLTAVFIRQLRNVRDKGGEIPPQIHYVMAVLCKAGMFQRGKN
ncbi:type I-F CRISPR-associated protein Csy3 [Photobacterium proteolyticum]|uniref:Type I-F CRISPR-associated protein Csy3 n=1 Tax=Photobacterium proteolyticum TaxID=1903952 RepID=A0A1Q9H1J3_9GAMM|nr:type I-F CRISPR-associated protein Csy3 [Photobacterium proteolyticum]OLQ81487.1 type I-F CRISPR-associated protein Csy3 [Photobacterium proteolyticum]